MKKYSIENSEQDILKPNSEFERRIILQYYLDNDISINNVERNILNKCTVSEPESIGIIGCLLNDKSYINTLRLAIGSKNKSNKKLSETAKMYFNADELKKADKFYSIDKDFDNFTNIEKVVNREFNYYFFNL
ncbi:hypothetical protein [Polaribacter ponticola]|uniref:Uncharacterized protein n=1 Tax=Polaribacter ponticola TaxID=2978475 RepID=A0ABT5S845_9FLAO|nr:hypothetical protein [Polaribacter sp. MSW5]MDD7914271.1 hypothetical protein [Polaribacter sp. MSW5]